MNMKDTIQTAAENMPAAIETAQSAGINWWMIIALAEALVIVALLLFRRDMENARSRARRNVLQEGNIDFANIVNSSFNAEKIYKELIRQCHPDRFAPDAEKVAIAGDISTRLGKCKHDIRQLEALKAEAVERLGIEP